jgi:hypothetical protein
MESECTVACAFQLQLLVALRKAPIGTTARNSGFPTPTDHFLQPISLFTMDNHRISDDLKEAALCLQDDGHSTAYIK